MKPFSYFASFFQNPNDQSALNLLRRIDENPNACDGGTFDLLITYLAETSSPSPKIRFAEVLHQLVHYGEQLIATIFSRTFSTDIERHLKQCGASCWQTYVLHAISGTLKTNPLLLESVRRDALIRVRSAPLQILDDLPESITQSILESAIHDSAQPIRSRSNSAFVQRCG